MLCPDCDNQLFNTSVSEQVTHALQAVTALIETFPKTSSVGPTQAETDAINTAHVLVKKLQAIHDTIRLKP
jgi:hypothetical protein